MQVKEKLLRINRGNLFSLLKFILQGMSHGFFFSQPFLETIVYIQMKFTSNFSEKTSQNSWY